MSERLVPDALAALLAALLRVLDVPPAETAQQLLAAFSRPKSGQKLESLLRPLLRRCCGPVACAKTRLSIDAAEHRSWRAVWLSY